MQILPLTNANTLFNLEQQNFSDYYSLENCEQELSNEFKHYIVAQDNGEIVGYAGIMLIQDQAELLRIAVNNEHRKKGIAKLLLNYLLDYLKEKNVLEIFLEVNENNTTAINLYKSFNFVTIYTRKDYYGEGNNALILKRSIC